MIIINAYKSIIRSIGRNVLIGTIILTIALASCIALSIKSAASKAEESGINQMIVTGNISVDREKIMESLDGNDMNDMRDLMNQYQNLTFEEYEQYKDNSNVRSTYYFSSTALNASGDLEPVNNGTNSNTSNNTRQGGMGISGTGPGGGSFVIRGQIAMGDFSITGYSSEDAMNSFISGTSKLTEGEMFDTTLSDYNVIISSELATFNNLNIGDQITLVNPNKTSEEYELTIVGIYSYTSDSNESPMMFSTSMDPANAIYMSYSALNKIIEHSETNATKSTSNGNETTTALTGNLTYTYTFANIADYEAFGKYLNEELSEFYTLSSSDINNYESSLIPLKNLNSFATTMLFLVLVVGGIILIVLNMFNIRERKYEVGVLTAIGIKKPKVAAQFVLELLSVTLIAVIIGAGIGAIVSVPVSNNLLASQIEAEEASSKAQEENFGRPAQGNSNNDRPSFNIGNGRFSISTIASNPVEYLDEIDATINITVLTQLIGIGIALTIVSSLGAIIFVLRYEPLKILAERV